MRSPKAPSGPPKSYVFLPPAPKLSSKSPGAACPAGAHTPSAIAASAATLPMPVRIRPRYPRPAPAATRTRRSPARFGGALPECRPVAWVESHSLSFSARHETAHVEEAAAVLAALEVLRDELAELYEVVPDDVGVVIHPRALALALAHPWLPLARRAAAPAARRYYAGWFGEHEIHVLAPPALERRASGVSASREALLRSPQHEYAHLVIGANNPSLPPPFSVATFRRYVRWAWLCEGAATWLSGQAELLRPAIVRRLREGGQPAFPPEPRDAMLLGGTVFGMLEQEHGTRAAAALATTDLERGPRSVLVDAFGRQLSGVEEDWRELLASMTAAG